MLTENQKTALNFEKHLSVIANAGAGKTTVLVQRFVEILLHTDTHVKEVVAITFTEKASSELRKRITDHIEDKIVQTKDSKNLQKLERIKDQLSFANIGTIHSFCAQLLREFPVEADIDASFTILEGVDQQLMEGEALREILETLLSDSENILRDAILDVVRMLGRKKVEEYLQAFLIKREQVERLIQNEGYQNPAITDDQILHNWEKKYHEMIVIYLDDTRWRKSLETILMIAKGKHVNEISSVLKSWDPLSTPEDKINRYRKITETIFTQKGELRKDFLGAKMDISKLEIEINNITEHHQKISHLLSTDGTEGIAGDRILLRVVRVLFEVFQSVLKRYSDKKLEYGYLDFEDILQKTRSILLNPEIRKAVSRRFKFIMVDEFQDTNRLQYEIFQQLIEDFQHGNLFVVGDPKQSIYGFRDAEVEVFETVNNRIEKLEEGGGVTLAESFRLLPNLIDFVNRIISKIMNVSDSKYDVRYDELVQGRKSKADGVVELLLVRSNVEKYDENDSLENKVDRNTIAAECKMIAQRIANLIQSGQTIYHGKDEISRTVEYKDIAILLRRRTHLAILRNTLTEFNIPAIFTGGMGFYQTQEVYDFLNYFRFLLNPGDDIAFVGILRSPLFAVSDAEIFTISLEHGESLWNKFLNVCGQDNISSGFKRIRKIMQYHLDLVNRVSISFLVRDIFFKTGWQGVMWGAQNGDQHAANIYKLLQIAQEFEGKGYTTIYDFVKRLEMLVEHEEYEGQASQEVVGNCIHVMTIHAAKGLEFPIVFLPFTNQKFRYDSPPFIDPKIGVGVKVNTEQDFNKELTPQMYKMLKHCNCLRIEAEEKRIFYVGCTRARDMLIISGGLNESSKYISYLGWLQQVLFIDKQWFKGDTLTLPSIALKTLEVRNGSSSVHDVMHELKIVIRYSVENNLIVSQKFIDKPMVHLPYQFQIEPVQHIPRGAYYSATQVTTYLECPMKYYLKYILGLPEPTATPYEYDESAESDDILRGDHEGILTHSVLQTINKTMITKEEIYSTVEEKIQMFGINFSEYKKEVVEIITNNVLNFVKSSYGKTVLEALNTKTEYPICISFGYNYLIGKIDRLYQNINGEWNIVDYKTDKINSRAMDIHAAIYRPQLLFYALLLNRLYHQNQVDASLVFLRFPSHPIHFKFDEDIIKQYKNSLYEIIKKIDARIFNKNTSVCDICSYYSGKTCLFEQ